MFLNLIFRHFLLFQNNVVVIFNVNKNYQIYDLLFVLFKDQSQKDIPI